MIVHVKSRHAVSLHTDFEIEACRRRLEESIDPERRTIFSLSGYKGSKSIIGRVHGFQFLLHERRYCRNDFAPCFYGTLHQQSRGTLIEGYFDMRRWTKWFMRVWLSFAVVVGGFIFVSSLWDLIRTRQRTDGDLVGLWVPAILIIGGFLMPRFGLWLSRHEEERISEFLCSTLVAFPSLKPPGISQ